MAFRKWLLAFAVVALLSSLAVPASAQTFNTGNVICSAVSGGNTPLVRGEGIAELVGDVVLNCTGGNSTPAGLPVPLINVQIFLSTDVTSRIVSSSAGLTEALLIIDEPAAANQIVCDRAEINGTPGTCATNFVGLGGSTGYNPTTGAYTGAAPYGTTARPSVFQGRYTATQPNAITWLGIPFDPPGTAGTGLVRTLRISNIRANASRLGASSTLIPSQITEFISISGVNFIQINNPQATVAFIQNGINPVTSTTATFAQCVSNNIPPISSISFTSSMNEGFAYAFKIRNRVQETTPLAGYGADIPQQVLNQTNYTESGVVNPAWPTTYGTNNAGRATQGTRLYFTFGQIPTGAQLWVPAIVPLTNQAGGALTGFAVLVSNDPTAGGGTGSAISGLGGTGTTTLSRSVPISISTPAGLAAATAFATAVGAGTPAGSSISYSVGYNRLANGTAATATAVYEVVATDPNSLETVNIGSAVAFTADPGNNSPAAGPNVPSSTVNGGFAPTSSVTTASAVDPAPRFVPKAGTPNTFLVNLCSCNILFPFVTNQQNFDTGIAIANTSQDPYGTTPQQGTVTVNFYGTPTQAAQTTNAPVPAGQILTFTLSGGGNFGITPAAGFQGYLIAQTRFQYCHGLAFITAAGAGATGQGVSESYLGIVLDSPFKNFDGGNLVNRTGQFGEVQAH